MPTISDGSNATISVGVDDIVTVQCPNGSYRYEYPVGTLIGEFTGTRSFGPYAAAGSIKLTSVQRAVTYEVGSQSDRSALPRWSDSQGLSLVRPNGTLTRLAYAGRPLTIIPAGDSITASNSTYSLGLWQWSQGYAESSIAQSGARFRMLRNAGVAGNTSAQLLARIDADVIAYAPDVCLLLIGTNDLSSGMSNSSIATLMNNVETIVLKLLSAGILPVLVTPPPKDTATTEAKKVQPFYYRLAQYYGLPLVDIYRYLVNPQGGAYASGNSSDGTHPIAAGITKMITATTAVLSNLAGSFCAPYLAAASETVSTSYWNLLRNGSFGYVTSSPTPDSWTVNTTNATQTIPAATLPYSGNTFTYNKTVSGAAYALSGQTVTVAGGGIAVGDVLQMNVRLKVTELTPATATGFQIGIASDAGGKHRTNSWVQNGDHILSTELTVPASTTTLTPSLYVVDVALYEVNNFTLLNVTQANAIWTPGAQN